MFFIRSEQGRLEERLASVKSLVEQYPQVVALRCALTLSYAQLGQTAQARRELEELARNDFCDIPRDESWLGSLSALSGVVGLLGDAPRAQLLSKLLLPYANRCVVIGALLGAGSISRALGLLAMTLSQYDDSARHFDQALEMNTKLRAPLWIGHTQHGYARMLLLRDRPGDREKALQLLTDALATAQQLGCKALADAARFTAEAGHLPALPRST
jgi:tetratricopeptide (TPR) repeat protein